MKCAGCKYLSQYGCTVVSLCLRNDLLKILPKHIQETAIDRYKKAKK